MEALTSLMSKIDLNSKIIPEGDYLEMCNSIKEVHKVLKYCPANIADYSSSDDEDFNMVPVISPVTPPFSTVDRRNNRNRYYEEEDLANADADADADDDNVITTDPAEREELLNYINSIRLHENDVVRRVLPRLAIPNETMYDERGPFINELSQVEQERHDAFDAYMHEELDKLNEEITTKLKERAKLKPRQRITAVVRKDAVRSRAGELGFRLSRYTVGALLDKGHDVGDVRNFYRSYLEDYNYEIECRINDLDDELDILRRDRDELFTAMNIEI
tara:strand:- start:492 stop:1319 length:828 start_codon:yes stop_codon:yes gene_type:complete